MASLAPMIVDTTDQVISRFSPEVRQCYSDEEVSLRTLSMDWGFRYSKKNCFYAALIEKVFSNCSCVPEYYGLPDELTANLTTCR